MLLFNISYEYILLHVTVFCQNDPYPFLINRQNRMTFNKIKLIITFNDLNIINA